MKYNEKMYISCNSVEFMKFTKLNQLPVQPPHLSYREKTSNTTCKEAISPNGIEMKLNTLCVKAQPTLEWKI